MSACTDPEPDRKPNTDNRLDNRVRQFCPLAHFYGKDLNPGLGQNLGLLRCCLPHHFGRIPGGMLIV